MTADPSMRPISGVVFSGRGLAVPHARRRRERLRVFKPAGGRRMRSRLKR